MAERDYELPTCTWIFRDRNQQSDGECRSMYSLARENVLKGFDMILSGDDTRFAEVEETENTIDLYNISISRRLSKVLTIEHGPAETKRLNSIFQITGNVERVGDHAMNFAEHAVLSGKRD